MSLLNAVATKKFALTFAAKNRQHPFNRVGADFMQELERDLERMIGRKIMEQPSKGKTLRHVNPTHLYNA